RQDRRRYRRPRGRGGKGYGSPDNGRGRRRPRGINDLTGYRHARRQPRAWFLPGNLTELNTIGPHDEIEGELLIGLGADLKALWLGIAQPGDDRDGTRPGSLQAKAVSAVGGAGEAESCLLGGAGNRRTADLIERDARSEISSARARGICEVSKGWSRHANDEL